MLVGNTIAVCLRQTGEIRLISFGIRYCVGLHLR